jgi:hypothetical protein
MEQCQDCETPIHSLWYDIHRGDTFVLLEISSYYLNCANYYFFHPILGECKTFSSVKDMNARMCFASNGA